MRAGDQIVAPAGWRDFSGTGLYFYLGSNAKRARKLIVEFRQFRADYWRAHLLATPFAAFEEAVLAGRLQVATTPIVRPPWLHRYGDQNLEMLDASRQHAAQKHAARVARRLDLISPFVSELESILQSEDPMLTVRTRARREGQNPDRIQLWLLTFLCFGRNRWSLMPPFANAGRWERSGSGAIKRGRGSLLHGKHFGHNVDDQMRALIKQSYIDLQKRGSTMSAIWTEAVRKVWGCTTKKGVLPSGRSYLYVAHPAGSPFPTLEQYRYHVNRQVSRATVQINRYGEHRVRAEKSVSIGPFAASYSNLYERVEVDAFRVAEKPRAFGGTHELPELIAVRGRCAVSGALLGIGFSFGSETRAAYRMMLFSSAIGKVRFCKLFGIEIEPSDWPCEGLPPHFLSDRGPAGHRKMADEAASKLAIRAIAPSFHPRSKSIIESSNPRNTRMVGPPNHLRSDHDPVMLARSVIIDTMTANNSMDVCSRLTNEMIAGDVIPNPLGVWEFLDTRGRNDAQPLPFEDAVRAFLTPRKFALKDSAAYLEHVRFNSPKLADSGIFERSAAAVGTTIDGYILDLCVRHVWVEIDGKLIQLSAELPISDDTDQLYISIEELDHLSALRRTLSNAGVQHRQAAQLDAATRFHEDTGADLHGSRRIAGKPTGKRKVSCAETSEFKKYATSRRK